MTGGIVGPTTWELKSSGTDYSRLVMAAGGTTFSIGTDPTMVLSKQYINVTNKRIVNVGTPIANSDAATKAYVDSYLSSNSNIVTPYWVGILGSISANKESITVPSEYRESPYYLFTISIQQSTPAYNVNITTQNIQGAYWTYDYTSGIIKTTKEYAMVIAIIGN